MYQAMLVDDEILIRQSLKKMIVDTDLSIQVVCEARNAKEALNLLNSIQPDLIITDMKMPEADGIMLMDELNRSHKHIKVIVISGYSDYKYMKKAISIDAADYLLKPITLKDLNTTLCKVIKSIEDDQQKEIYKKEMLTNNKRKKEIFLQNLSNARIAHLKDIKTYALKFKIPLSLDSYTVIIFAFRDLYKIAEQMFSGNMELLIGNIEDIIYSTFKDNPSVHIFKTDDRTKICLLTQTMDMKDNHDCFDKITSAIQMQLNVDIIGGISLPFNNLAHLHQHFKEALEALYNNLLNKKQSAFCIYIKQKQHKEFFRICDADIRILSRAIISKNTFEIKNSFSKINENLESHDQISLKDTHKLYLNLIMEIKTALSTLKLNDETLIPYMDIDNIKKINSFTQFSENINIISNKIVQIINNEKSSDMLHIMKDVEAYIHEHYNEDISLVDIAFKYHFEPTYFSKMFKTIIKVGFMEYVISLRMKKACDFLINSTLKVNDISAMVGYENQRYFSQLFKKFTGYTPTQYRANCLEDQQKNLELN